MDNQTVSPEEQNDEKELHAEIKLVLERAITDPEYKELLLTDTDKALESYELTEVQILLIKSLDAGDLDKLTLDNLEEYFSADAAVYTPDDATSLEGYEMYSIEDM